MLQAMLSGVSGLKAHQTKMGVIGNNIANVNTTGYKASAVTFKDQLSQTLSGTTAPSDTLGGTNAKQVGTGVAVGAASALQTQGSLTSTGSTTDIAIQGSGALVVSDGSAVHYTRDGAFSVDAEGNIVHTATGLKLVGVMAVDGQIDTSAAVNAETTIKIPVGATLPASATTAITLSGVLDTDSRNYSTYVNYSGNLSSADTAGDTTTTTTVYDANGASHTVQMTFTNASDADDSAPTGATRQWDVTIAVDGASVYDSAASDSKIYYVPGSGWVFPDSAGVNQSYVAVQVPGSGSLEPFSVQLNMGALTNQTSTSQVEGTGDGEASSTANWGNSVTIYDSLGNSHIVSFKYTHVPLASTPTPADGATNQWNWTATDENGSVIGTSADTSNSPLYFDTAGNLVGDSKQALSLMLNSNNGSSSPVTIVVDTAGLQQVAGDSSAAASQNGYKAGTLTSYSIAADGIITGTFSSGESRTLAQVVLATFPNSSGLTKSGANLLDVSSNSGTPSIGVPGKNGRGSLASGYLEGSNVDLSEEFTSMIVTQRGYQANTRIITTIDDMLQEVINLKR